MEVYVHRYRWSHDKKRKKYRRLYKEGKVNLVCRCNEWFIYEAVQERS